jgi:hypothetical protein
MQLLQELILLTPGGSTAAITRTDVYPTVAPLRPITCKVPVPILFVDGGSTAAIT